MNATEHTFADPNMADAIASAPKEAKYRLTRDPEQGCLLFLEDNRDKSRQTRSLRLPDEDWIPFLLAVEAEGKTLIPDWDPDDTNDITPPW